MPDQQSCSLCGQPIRFAALANRVVKLDVTPSLNAPYRLVGDQQNQAEQITRPGFYGYTDHEETCPRKTTH